MGEVELKKTAQHRRELIEKFVKDKGWFIPALHEKYIASKLERSRPKVLK
jgi:hypothetical protein